MNSCLAVEDRQKLSHVRLMRVHNEKGSARKDELPLVCSGGYRTARVFDGLRGPGVEVTQHYIPPTGLPTECIDSPKPPEKSSQPRVAHLWQKSALRTK